MNKLLCIVSLFLIGCVPPPHYIKREPQITRQRGPDVPNAPTNEGHGGMITYRFNDDRPLAYQKMHDYCAGNYRITNEATKEETLGASGGTTASTLNFIPGVGPTTIANHNMMNLIDHWHEVEFECEK